MSKQSGCGRIGPKARTSRIKKAVSAVARRLGFETLEHRRLLAVAAPTSVIFQPQTGQGSAALTSANNSSTSASRELTFVVAGVTAGDTVDVFADGSTTPIATGTVATGATTATATSSGNLTLTDGSHTFTATQSDTASPPDVSASSPASASVQIFAGLTLAQVSNGQTTVQTAASATVGTAFTYTAQTNAPAGDTATITAGSTLLPGMSFDTATNTFSGWTPTSADAGTTQQFTVNLSDTIGNSTTVTVFVAVAATSGITALGPPASVVVGSPVLTSFNDATSGTPTYTVTSSNPSELSATLMQESSQVANPVLQIATNYGDIDIELLQNYTPNTVAHIVNLINSGDYTNTSFYRIVSNFVIQGGTGGTGGTIPVELSPDLRFTSSGLLAMANNGVDGNSSEFFLTGPDDVGSTNTDLSDGFLDFRYTIFGKLVSGDNVRQAIAAAQVGPGSSGEDSAPFEAPQIMSMSIISDPNAGALLLKATAGATGPYTVTVTDGLGGSTSFMVSVGGTNPFDPPNPWVKPINGTDTINTAYQTAATFTPQGESADNTAVQVAAQLMLPVPTVSGAFVDSSYMGTNPPADTTNPDMTLVNNNGTYTVTPDSGFYGVQYVEITGQSATAASWDASSNINPVYTSFVPVYVDPPAPQIASISTGGKTVTGSTFSNNASTATELSFNISGAIAGATVSVFVNGDATPIATGTVASGATTITLATDGATKIADGSHTFTVEQTISTSAATMYADWTSGSSGSSPGIQFPIAASSVNSAASAGTALSIGLTVLAPPTSPAAVGVPYSYTVQTNAPAGDTLTVTYNTSPYMVPQGMTFNAGTNTFNWTPTAGQANTAPEFYVQVSDTSQSPARMALIGPLDISVVVGLAPTQVPVNSSGGDVTVKFIGSKVLVYDNLTHAALSDATFAATDTVQVDLPAGQTNSVLVMLPASGAAVPKELLVQGASGSTNNHVTILGTSGANTFTLAGDAATANGLNTTMTTVQVLTLAGFGGSDYYKLNSSSIASNWVVDTGGYNTMDFSQDTAGVHVNLGLDKGQAQSIAPWNASLSIYGVINKLVGSAFADVLTGGPAATTEIVSGIGNDMITGGSGDNILMGGGGNDTIVGGPDRNLLIAGNGTSSLYANGTQNTVFDGTTNYDSNDQALLNLLDQGAFYSFSYSVRRALASAAANPSLLSQLLTFQDSGAHDTIFGSGGSNWFVPGKNGTVKS